MDNIQNIIFTILGILYLIYSAFSRGKDKQPKAGTPPPAAGEDIPSLEDLLKEISGTGNRQQKTNPAPKAKPVVRQVEEKTRKEATAASGPLTTSNTYTFERQPSYEQLENAEKSYEYKSSTGLTVPRLERTPLYRNEAELVNYEDPLKSNYAGLDKRQPRFEQFDKEQKKTNMYAQLLRNRDSARQAFIFSEIFKRKY
jgi:hypothetical protein